MHCGQEVETVKLQTKEQLITLLFADDAPCVDVDGVVGFLDAVARGGDIKGEIVVRLWRLTDDVLTEVPVQLT
jgi:hypothetical protein